jgi:hypothetical protein
MNKIIIKLSLLFLLVSVLFSCGISTDDLAKQVQSSLIKNYENEGVKI